MKMIQIMLTTLSAATAIASQSTFAASFTQLQNVEHVTANECMIFVDMHAQFPLNSELSAFGGAGSDEDLSRLSTISDILTSRGYTVTTDERLADYKLELQTGVQCVMTEGHLNRLESWMLDNIETNIYAAGRFSGKRADGTFFENTAKRTFIGLRKTAHFRSLVGKIVSYCRTAR